MTGRPADPRPADPLAVLREALSHHIDVVTGEPVLFGKRKEAMAAVERLVEAARGALDCKGSYRGVVSEKGGDPAVCTRCEERLRDALAPFKDAPPS